MAKTNHTQDFKIGLMGTLIAGEKKRMDDLHPIFYQTRSYRPVASYLSNNLLTIKPSLDLPFPY